MFCERIYPILAAYVKMEASVKTIALLIWLYRQYTPLSPFWFFLRKIFFKYTAEVIIRTDILKSLYYFV